MNITRNDTAENLIELTVTVEENDYAEKVDKALRRYRKEAKMPGFRPGMVPLGMVKKMYGRAVKGQEVEHQMEEAIFDYINENKIEVLGHPLPIDEEGKEIDWNNDKSFTFKFELGIAPAFEPDFSKADIVKRYKVAVSDEMIDQQVKNYQDRFGSYQEVDHAEGKDMIKGSMRELDENGNPKEGGIAVEEATMAADYIKDEEQKKLLDGIRVGASVRFNPKKAYQSDVELRSMLNITTEQAANMDSDFMLEVKSITHFSPSELNRELFDKVYGENKVTTEEEFRQKVAEGIVMNFNADSEYRLSLDLRKMAIDKMKGMVLPEDFLRRALLASNEKMTEATLTQQLPQMLDDVKWQVLENRISRAKNIEYTEEEVHEMALRMGKLQFAQYGMTEVPEEILNQYIDTMLQKEERYNDLASKVKEEKVMKEIESLITVEEAEISPEEFNKLFSDLM